MLGVSLMPFFSFFFFLSLLSFFPLSLFLPMTVPPGSSPSQHNTRCLALLNGQFPLLTLILDLTHPRTPLSADLVT